MTKLTNILRVIKLLQSACVLHKKISILLFLLICILGKCKINCDYLVDLACLLACIYYLEGINYWYKA